MAFPTGRPLDRAADHGGRREGLPRRDRGQAYRAAASHGEVQGGPHQVLRRASKPLDGPRVRVRETEAGRHRRDGRDHGPAGEVARRDRDQEADPRIPRRRGGRCCGGTDSRARADGRGGGRWWTRGGGRVGRRARTSHRPRRARSDKEDQEEQSRDQAAEESRQAGERARRRRRRGNGRRRRDVMPLLRTKEIRAMDAETIAKKLTELRDELMHERGVAAMGGAPPNPGKIRALRKNIARILTIMREEELAGGAAAPRKAAPAKAAPSGEET